MGNCSSQNHKVDTLLLESCWLSTLLTPVDLAELLLVAKSERQILSSNPSLLPINADRSLFLVTSGEVVLSISTDHSGEVPLVIFYPGDVFFAFPGMTYSSGTISCGEWTLTYRMRGGGKVLHIDRQPITLFAAQRLHLAEFEALFGASCNLELELLSSPAFRSFSATQLHIFMCMMRVSRVLPGQVIKLHDETIVSHYARQSQKLVGSGGSSDDLLTPVLSKRSLGLCLGGQCTFVPAGEDLLQQSQSIASGTRPVGRRRSVGMIAVLARSDSEFSHTSTLRSTGLGPDGADDSCGFGTLFGLEKSFVENNNLMSDTVIAQTAGFVAHVSRDALNVLFRLDPTVATLLRRNYVMAVLGNLRDHIALLRDAESDTLSSLCAKVTLRGFSAGDVIFKRSNVGTCSYIVIHGVVQESLPKNGFGFSAKSGKDGSIMRRLTHGSFFGEAALARNACHLSTARALEYTIVACISKRVLEEAYCKNKTKLAEICIRMAGMDADLDHILMHPESNGLLCQFLEMERAQENLLFLNAVAHFEDSIEEIRLFVTNAVSVASWEEFWKYCRSRSDAPGEETFRPAVRSAITALLHSRGLRTKALINSSLKSLGLSRNSSQSSSKSGSVRSRTKSRRPSLSFVRKSIRSVKANIDAGVVELELSPSVAAAYDNIFVTIAKMLDDAKRAAHDVVVSFVRTDSEQQANLPDKLRKSTELALAKVQARSLCAVLDVIFEVTLAKENQQGREDVVKNRTLEYNLFRAAKTEIVKLLREDGYQRWKKTPEFSGFVYGLQLESGSLSSKNAADPHTYPSDQSYKDSAMPLTSSKAKPKGVMGWVQRNAVYVVPM